MAPQGWNSVDISYVPVVGALALPLLPSHNVIHFADTSTHACMRWYRRWYCGRGSCLIVPTRLIDLGARMRPNQPVLSRRCVA